MFDPVGRGYWAMNLPDPVPLTGPDRAASESLEPVRRRSANWTPFFLVLLLLWPVNVMICADVEGMTSKQREFFETRIRPLLVESCLECHSGEKGKTKGGLNMDHRDFMIKGGESGPVLKPGNVNGSLMIKAVTWEDDLQMPPKKKLNAAQIADLKEWVAMGAPDPRTVVVAPKDKKTHWAFQPLVQPKLPEVKNPSWCVNSIDRFVLSKLEQKHMLPATPASKEALLRRAYFDLIGLPPSPKQIEEFVRAPDTEAAYSKVIDDLLNDPGYGERWARHWLDTARYSDTAGANAGQAEFRYAYAYSYRDWVINALNEDMPYNRFVINQLAADKVPDNPRENLAALGFLTVGQRFRNKDDIINDRIDAVGRGFLGLTIACARCHDHKFDPITAADYYALRGVFDSIGEPIEGPVIAGDPNSSSYIEFNKKIGAMEKEVVDTFYRNQRQASDVLRKNGSAIFEAAYLSRRDSTNEEKLASAALISKAKLTARVVDDSGKLNDRNPGTGVFLKMINLKGDRTQVLGGILDGSSRGPRVNSEVLRFLKAQRGPLPSDPHQVAELYGKMLLEFEPRVAALFAEIRDETKKLADSPNRDAMELAVFPGDLIAPRDLSMERLRQDRALRGIFARINEFKLTYRGGPVRAMVVEDLPRAKDSPLFVRGNPPKGGEEIRIVPRRFIEVLSGSGGATPFKLGSGRLELAEAIASTDNPLTARVLVNRVWMYHFGEGLVRTPDDLGNQAGMPSHPELLEFLASWFMEDFGVEKPAWSLKGLHKAIMLSKAYRQSSNTAFRTASVDYQKMDPSNSMLWHANVRRLDFESFRDSLLSMAGTLDRKEIGGPSVNITEEPYSFRRSVYGYIDRASMPELLMQFDMANPDQPNTKRTSTIVPQQALFLMNSPFVSGVVQRIVSRPEVIQAVKGERSTEAGISAVFRIVLQRLPTAAERKLATTFLVKESKKQAEMKAQSVKLNKEGAMLAERKLQAARNNGSDTKAIVNEGNLVERAAFSPWETLVQSLLFCNEAVYVN